MLASERMAERLDFTIVTGDGAGSTSGEDDDDTVNMGIASAVPGWKLRELLYQSDMVAHRESVFAMVRAARSAPEKAGRIAPGAGSQPPVSA
jgi:hypothetical protein